MTVIILFKRKGKSYRMRLPRIHQHPGESDQFEVAGKDMMDHLTWSPVFNGRDDVPSGEWLVRRALWHILENGLWQHTADLATIDLGEV